MNNTEHARVRRLRRRANRLGAHGARIIPKRVGSGAKLKEGWQLIENKTNLLLVPSAAADLATLDEVEEAIEKLEEAVEAE